FTLAMRAGKVASKPYIAKLQLDNARKVFFEPAGFQSVVSQLPEHLKPVAICAYVTGWRVHDEILTRQRHDLDLRADWLRIGAGGDEKSKGQKFSADA